MSKKIILESFKILLKDVKGINDINKNKNSNRKELQDALQNADDLIFLNHSNFSTFYESVNEYICSGYKPYSTNIFNKTKLGPDIKKRIPLVEVKAIYNQLIEDERAIDFIDTNAAIKKDNHLGADGVILPSLTGVSNEINEMHKTLKINHLSKPELQTILGKYLREIVSLINALLLNDIYRIFEKRKINEEVLPEIFRYNPKLKNDYIQKWVDCTVTSNEIKRFKTIDYWTEIMELGLDDDEIQNIEVHQKKTFLKVVKSKLKERLDELNSLPNKLLIAKQYTNLIEKFFNGEKTEEDEIRLCNILFFNNSAQVLVSYDEMLKEAPTFNEFIIYDFKTLEYTSIFIAVFFMSFLQELKIILKNETKPEMSSLDKSNSKGSKKKEIKSFTYINISRNPDAIKNLKNSLEKKELIKENTPLIDFKSIFNGQEVKSKICWIGTKEKLVYFVRQLKKLKLIKSVKAIWQITVKCFVDSDVNEFEPNNLRSQKPPADTTKIDRILHNLKTDST